ncbi:hypothetical protein WAI453_002466 [Rhynchosporium graminicola]
MQDAGWRPQSQEGKEEVEILLNDRRSFESVSGRASARGDNEDQPEKGIEDEYENESESESENGESDQGPQRGLSRSTKGTIWVVLMTMSTLLGRRLLRGSFPYRECISPRTGFIVLYWLERSTHDSDPKQHSSSC